MVPTHETGPRPRFVIILGLMSILFFAVAALYVILCIRLGRDVCPWLFGGLYDWLRGVLPGP